MNEPLYLKATGTFLRGEIFANGEPGSPSVSVEAWGRVGEALAAALRAEGIPHKIEARLGSRICASESRDTWPATAYDDAKPKEPPEPTIVQLDPICCNVFTRLEGHHAAPIACAEADEALESDEEEAVSDAKCATWDELNLTLEVLGGQAAVFGSMNLDGCIRLLDDAENVGPMLDPTGWMKHHRSWPPAKRVLETAAAFVAAVRANARTPEGEVHDAG